MTTTSAGTFTPTKRRKQEKAPGLSPHLISGVKHLFSLTKGNTRSVRGATRPPPSRAGGYEHLVMSDAGLFRANPSWTELQPPISPSAPPPPHEAHLMDGELWGASQR